MTQMDDSTSDTTRDDADIQSYNITAEDMCRLKDKIGALEAEVRAVDPQGSHSPASTVLQTVSDLKESLEKIKSTSVVIL
jgi:hypothetical protein